MIRRTAGAAIWVLLAQVLAGPAGAEVYKSVDADGNVVFSQKPPPGADAEVVTPRYTRPPSNAGARSPAPSDAAPAEAPAAAAPAPDGTAAAAAPTPEQLAAKRANCSNARGQVERLTGPRANRLQYVNDDNELAFYSEEQRTQLIRDAQAAVAKYCD